ncbi:hypothetical protein BJ508DRAFT_313592 [Ascobolus immersus RN42]|uniref:Uncharacterized protein n=1 Tax=Ascobolus immersus RN42 TaxID=1160509 RepID=A0A3N4HIF8_ASCIM|nr:hypothetical protein BJ508DRAFT_313592 [Ascobolus immersus RN42]
MKSTFHLRHHYSVSFLTTFLSRRTQLPATQKFTDKRIHHRHQLTSGRYSCQMAVLSKPVSSAFSPEDHETMAARIRAAKECQSRVIQKHEQIVKSMELASQTCDPSGVVLKMSMGYGKVGFPITRSNIDEAEKLLAHEECVSDLLLGVNNRAHELVARMWQKKANADRHAPKAGVDRSLSYRIKRLQQRKAALRARYNISVTRANHLSQTFPEFEGFPDFDRMPDLVDESTPTAENIDDAERGFDIVEYMMETWRSCLPIVEERLEARTR